MRLAPALHVGRLAVAPAFRPGGPAPGLRIFAAPFRLQAVVGRLITQAVAAVAHEICKRLPLRVIIGAQAELRPGVTQRGELQRHHRRVVDELAIARFRQRALGFCRLPPLLRRRALLEVLQLRHADIDNIEPASGRGAVGAGEIWRGGIERVQRIEPDEIAALTRNLLQKLLQIAKIADAPVIGGTHGIKLYQRAPAFLAVAQRFRQPAAAWRQDNARLPLLLAFAQRQLVVAVTER